MRKVGIDTLFILVGFHEVPATKPHASGLKYSLSHLALHMEDDVEGTGSLRRMFDRPCKAESGNGSFMSAVPDNHLRFFLTFMWQTPSF
jgi:hypothetical protein